MAYQSGGVRHRREYFTSYPDKLLVIRLEADQPGAVSFRVRPRIPDVDAKRPGDARTAAVKVEGGLVTLSGTTALFGCRYEAQVSIKQQMAKLDPILIGSSGQIKEYREEDAYSDIGDPKHRHISHLCRLYPGTLIHSSRPEWMAAARKTLDLRGDRTTG